METVWLVWSKFKTSGNATHPPNLVAVCDSQSVALQVVEEEKKKIEKYHGDRFPIEWEGLNHLRTQNLDIVLWEPRAVQKEKSS